MLETYNYECSMLDTANHLLRHDKLHARSILRSRQTHAFIPFSDECGHCQRSLADAPSHSKITLYNCGHTYHENCLPRDQTICPICWGTAADKRKTEVIDEEEKKTIDQSSRQRTYTRVHGGSKTKEYVRQLRYFQRVKNSKDRKYSKFEKLTSKFDEIDDPKYFSGNISGMLSLAPENEDPITKEEVWEEEESSKPKRCYTGVYGKREAPIIKIDLFENFSDES